MSLSLKNVTLVGVGLLGGSLGLGLKERGLLTNVRGVGHRQSSLDAALSIGAIDEAFLELAPAMENADLVVLCTPAAMVPEYLDQLLPLISEHTIVTDVASTKDEICAHAQATWPAPCRFVGSHPMAGSEKFGPEHADPDLYEGAVTFIESSAGLSEDAVAQVTALWQSLGSKVVPVEPHLHDQLVARTSHIPHIAAAGLAQLVTNIDSAAPFIGKGFKDTTRIAEGRPEIWRDICLTNSGAIRAGLSAHIDDLNAVLTALEKKDGDILLKFFEDGQVARKEALEE